jgi:hypothetical protein
LKSETFAVGAVCLLLGGLIGYISGTQVTFRQIKEIARPAGNQPDSGPPASPSQSAVPEGHPTITTSADMETLKRAVDAAPNNLTLVTELANKLYDAAKYEAIPYYRRVLTLNLGISNSTPGDGAFHTGQPDAAIAHPINPYRLIRARPNPAQSGHRQFAREKDVNAAKEALDRLKNVDPNNPSIPNLQSMISPSGTSQANPRQTLF